MFDLREICMESGIYHGLSEGVAKKMTEDFLERYSDYFATGFSKQCAECLVDIFVRAFVKGYAEARDIKYLVEVTQNLLKENFPLSKALEIVKLDEATYNTYMDIYSKNDLPEIALP